MTPEELIEKMVKASKEINKPGSIITFKQDAEAMLRIFLQAIKDGEVVEGQCAEDGKCAGLKPEYQKFMEEAK